MCLYEVICQCQRKRYSCDNSFEFLILIIRLKLIYSCRLLQALLSLFYPFMYMNLLLSAEQRFEEMLLPDCIRDVWVFYCLVFLFSPRN